MPVVICRSCHKQYTIPSSSKEYRCKACGGKCEVVSAPESSEYSTETELNLEEDNCPACFERLPSSETLSCPKCGHPLNEEPVSIVTQKQRPDPESLAEHQAARRILQGMKSLRWVRCIFGFGALYYGFLFLLIVTQVILGVPEGESDISFVSLLAISGFICLLMVFGTVKVYSQPIFWCISLALLVTIYEIMQLVPLGFTLVLGGPTLGLHILIVAFFWSTVVKAVNIKRLLREYPDIQIAKNLVATEGKLQHIDTSSRAKAATRRRRKKLIVGLAAATTVFIMAYIAFFYWIKANTPQNLDDASELFKSNWNMQGTAEETIDTISVFFGEEERAALTSQMESHFKKFNWIESHPPFYNIYSSIGTSSYTRRYSLVDPKKVERSRKQKDYDRYNQLSNAAIWTDWKLRDGKWYVVAVEFPKALTAIHTK